MTAISTASAYNTCDDHFTFVARLGNRRCIAMYVKGNVYKMLSKHPERHQKTAVITAQVFAASQNIYFDSRIFKLNIPIITLWKRPDGLWYPARLDSSHFGVFKTFKSIYGDASLGTTLQKAKNIAQQIAMHQRRVYMPALGFCLSCRKT